MIWWLAAAYLVVGVLFSAWQDRIASTSDGFQRYFDVVLWPVGAILLLASRVNFDCDPVRLLSKSRLFDWLDRRRP